MEEQKVLFNDGEVEGSKTHVWFKKCGCVTCLILNSPLTFGEIVKQTKYAEKHGEIYRLMDTAEVKELSWKCKDHQQNSLLSVS